MLDKVAPKSYAWRSSDQTDSGSESHPLLSSDTSRHSFGTASCMFPGPDSETSDFETAPTADATPSPQHLATRPQYLLVSRRPALYENHRNELPDATYSHFYFYSKLRSLTTYETHTVVPNHIASFPLFIPYFPGQELDTCKQGSLVTIFAIWNTIMSASLLSMPWGIERAGFLTGIFLMAIMGAVCMYTTYLLLELQKTYGIGHLDGDAADWCRMLIGRTAEMIAKVFYPLVLLSANVVYWILMSNFLFHSVEYIYGLVNNEFSDAYAVNENQSTSVLCPWEEAQNVTVESNTSIETTFQKIWNIHQTVPLFLIVIVGPLINFKSSTVFTKFNSLGALAILYLLIFVLVKGVTWGINVDFMDVKNTLYAPNFLASFPALSGMTAFSFFIHNIIITILKSSRHQENNGRDLSIAYILVTSTYVLVGVVFYTSFPLSKSCIDDNFLNNFQNTDIMTVIARIFLFLQLMTVFPLTAYMFRVQVFTILKQSSYPGFKYVFILNACVVAVCVIFAVYLPRIGTIMRFTGALSGFVYIFTLPSILQLVFLTSRGNVSWLSILLHILIPIFGGINLLTQFFV